MYRVAHSIRLNIIHGPFVLPGPAGPMLQHRLMLYRWSRGAAYHKREPRLFPLSRDARNDISKERKQQRATTTQVSK